MRRRNQRTSYRTKRYLVQNEILNTDYIVNVLKVGSQVKHAFRDYSGRVIGIDNAIISVLWDNTDMVTEFSRVEFNKIMKLKGDNNENTECKH